MTSRSKIWNYFDKLEKDVQCKFCRYKTPTKSVTKATSNLWNHLRNKHSSSISDSFDTQIDPEVSSQSSSSSSLHSIQPKITGSFCTVRTNEQKQEVITQLITKMICVDTLPVSFVENVGFKKLLAYIAPSYIIPVKKTIQLRIDALYESEKSKRVEEINDINILHIACTTDCWSSRANESYISVTGHYISSNWQHISVNLTTELIEERHTIQNLQEKIETILKEWRISEKCVAIVHDNAANIVGAVRRSPYESICCFAHSLQLCLNKILESETIKPTLSKCSSIVSHFKHSNIATAALKNKQVQLGLQKRKLIQSVKTRWNSTFLMTKRIVEQREALISVLSDRTVVARTLALELMLTEYEWIVIENLIKLLEPFELVTTLLSSESQPTISMVMPILQSLQENFLSKRQDDEPEDLKTIRNLLLQEFTTRFKTVVCSKISITGNQGIDILDISTFLDPRFKNKERFIGSLYKVKTHIKDILDIPEYDVVKEVECPTKKSALDILFPNDDDVSVYSRKDGEVDRYCLESAIPKDMCPLLWWKNNQCKFPGLSNLAKKYLCIPATSTPSERAFSNAGNIVTAKRSCLSAKNVQKICFLSTNL